MTAACLNVVRESIREHRKFLADVNEGAIKVNDRVYWKALVDLGDLEIFRRTLVWLSIRERLDAGETVDMDELLCES